jgi:hypothetical protein
MPKKITHRELCVRGSKWLNKKAGWQLKSQFVCCELVCQGGRENPDIFGLRPNGNVLIEVKVSRADFRKEFKKQGRINLSHAIGRQRLYMTPKGMLKPDEIPFGWGLIEYDGKNFEIVKDSEKFEEHAETVAHYYHSILRREAGYGIFDYRKKKTDVENEKAVEVSV